MCTFVLLQRVHPDYPVVIAANRDEVYARPTAAAAVLVEEPRVVGGRDRRSGGTWLGATAAGFVAGLTNQRTWRLPDPALRSRGEVVLEALRRGSVDGVEALLAGLDPRAYNPFNLVYGDAGGLRVAYARPDRERVELDAVPDGVHVLPNDRLDAPGFAKVARARALAARAGSPRELGRLLGDHHRPDLAEVTPPPPGSPFDRALARELDALCVHTPAYGTRSATVLALVDGAVARYLYADGPPCRTAFADLTGLLTARRPSAPR